MAQTSSPWHAKQPYHINIPDDDYDGDCMMLDIPDNNASISRKPQQPQQKRQPPPMYTSAFSSSSSRQHQGQTGGASKRKKPRFEPPRASQKH